MQAGREARGKPGSAPRAWLAATWSRSASGKPREVKVAVVRAWWRSERRRVRPSCFVTPTGLSWAREWFYLNHRGGTECSWWEEKWESRYLSVVRASSGGVW